MLCALFGLTGCLGGESSNVQTSPVMPAVVVNESSGMERQVLVTTWGKVIVPAYSSSFTANDGDCLLTQFQVDWDQQPNYATDGYITPTQLDFSNPIAQTPVTLIGEVPKPEDYDFPIIEVALTNYLLSKRCFAEITHKTFEKQVVNYRLALVSQTSEYVYDAYLMAKSSEEPTSGTPVDDVELHVLNFSAIDLPQVTESSTELPSITLNVKYYVGGEDVWRSISSPIKIVLYY
jgi:hypothetical protein